MNEDKIYTPGISDKAPLASSDPIVNQEIKPIEIPPILPRQVRTGTMRGTQEIGVTGTKIDASNNQIILTKNPDASSPRITIGDIGALIDQPGVAPTSVPPTNRDLGLTINNGTYDFLTLNSSGVKVNNGSYDFLTIDSSGLTENDGSKNRVLISPTGMKVSQAGYDVNTATDAQLVFNSAFNLFKIIKSGTISVAVAGGGTNTTSISHGFSFAPGVIAWVNVPFQLTSYNPTPYSVFDPATSTIASLAQMRVTTSTLTAEATSLAPAYDGTYTFKYYLVQETAS